MAADAPSASHFYGTACGGLACRLLREQLQRVWPDLTGQSLLGLGFTDPYLRAWRGQAARCIAAGPAHTGAKSWPVDGPNAATIVDDAALPFPDLSFDRILLVHGLETADNARAMLREVWRVLKDDGKLLVVAPNRVSVWAHVESTPFGHGQPYSPRQIDKLLAANLFRAERREFALYLPPIQIRLVLRTARLWERAGRSLTETLGGVTVTEAVKDAYAAIPVRRVPQRRLVLSKAA